MQERTNPFCFHGWRPSDPLIFIPPLFRFFLNENAMLIDYIPIFLLLAVAATLGIVLANINRFLGPRLPSEEKLSTYESGMEPIRTARDRFTVRFYLVAILFILFDVEIVFMYPWAVNFLSLGWFGLVEMVVFVVVLLIGYYYAIKKGALQWQ
jgi:NADH-quinone oxidoreductase subunit A